MFIVSLKKKTNSVYLQICARQVSKARPFPSNVIKIIWESIRDEKGDRWRPEVIKTGFKTLASVLCLSKFWFFLCLFYSFILLFCYFVIICYLLEQIYLYTHIYLYFDRIVSSVNEPVMNRKMLIELCVYTVAYLKQDDPFELVTRRELAAECMKCILIWLQTQPELAAMDADVSWNVAEVIRQAIKAKPFPKYQKPEAAAWANVMVAPEKNKASRKGGGAESRHGGSSSSAKSSDSIKIVKEIHRLGLQKKQNGGICFFFFFFFDIYKNKK